MEIYHPDWRTVPTVALCSIFEILTRRDRLAFVMVCQSWKEAVTCSRFWRKFVVYIDQDFMEPSLIHLTQEFYKYIKHLVIGWRTPMWEHRLKWPELKYKDLTKRVGKFLVILYERSVQINVLEINNWYDVFYIRKLGYLMLRIVKNQYGLTSITLNNANFHDMNFINILVSCLRSKSTLEEIHVHYLSTLTQRNFDGWIFTSCTEQFTNLKVFTVNIWVFWHFYSRLQVTLSKLTELNLYLDDSARIIDKITFPDIAESQWDMFHVLLPNVLVNLSVKKFLTDSQMKTIVQQSFPLASFVWKYKVNKECCRKTCAICLRLLTNNHRDTLQTVVIAVPDVSEVPFIQRIIFLKNKCKKLQYFCFNRLRWQKKKRATRYHPYSLI
ncbi:F-box only protein 39-like [Sitophilus oryzae]|uniref:F-box only protein 39-like n=1 Tax=Sitophilus oryzae TaxID=7048 RepID=A0A6J2YL11_SITOR|nr:F-box only protein 39-like [Sitophilus oryzae]